MEHWKSKCPNCGKMTCWIGPNHFFVKIDYPVCLHCGTQTRERDKSVDRQSVMGRTYEERLMNALVSIPDIHWDIDEA